MNVRNWALSAVVSSVAETIGMSYVMETCQFHCLLMPVTVMSCCIMLCQCAMVACAWSQHFDCVYAYLCVCMWGRGVWM